MYQCVQYNVINKISWLCKNRKKEAEVIEEIRVATPAEAAEPEVQKEG